MSKVTQATDTAAFERMQAARQHAPEPEISGVAWAGLPLGVVSASAGEEAWPWVRPFQGGQRQALAACLAVRYGNRHARELLWPLQAGTGGEPGAGASVPGRWAGQASQVQLVPDDEEGSSAAPATEAGAPSVAEVVVSEEEALEDLYGPVAMPTTEEIEANMQREIAMTEGTEAHLYVNMAGLIGGMPYDRHRMQGIFQTLRGARDEITQQPAYAQWRESPEDPARRAALDALVAQFEQNVGTGIREQIRDYWQGRQAGDPAAVAEIAEACTEIAEGVRTEREDLFPEGVELPATLEIPDADGLRSRMRELYQRVHTDLVPRTNRLSLGALGNEARAGPLAGLVGLKRRLDQSLNMVGPRLRGAAVSRFASRLTEALQLAQDAGTAFERLGEQMADHTRRAVHMAARVMDANAIPILIPSTRRTATVTFEGERTTYHTEHESRMSYYGEAYMLTGTQPPRSLDEAPSEGATGGNPRLRRVGEVFDQLRGQNVAVSEAKMLAAIAYSEGGFGSTQTVDLVRFSWGILSFQGGALMRLLRRIRDENPAVFGDCFESFGITIRERERTPSPAERQSRQIAGSEEGFQTHEAYGVQDLLVYDHRARVWVSGNEGLAVIQGDPRYQALFVAAGRTSAAQTAQMMEARSSFVHGVRNQSLTLGSGDAQHSLRVRDFLNNEVAMFGLVERKVANGNISFATAMFNRYLQDRGVGPAELSSRSQSDIAAWVRGYDGGFRWELGDNLEPAGVPGLRDDAYEGDI